MSNNVVSNKYKIHIIFFNSTKKKFITFSVECGQMLLPAAIEFFFPVRFLGKEKTRFGVSSTDFRPRTE
jgi:hypothetical protein